MFGWSEKEKLLKLANEVRGLSLKDAVERFATETGLSLSRPRVPFNLAAVRAIHGDVSGEEDFGEAAVKSCAAHGFDAECTKAYFAYRSFLALRIYAMDLAAACILMDDGEKVDYFFGVWLRDVPEYFCLPIIFSPQSGKSYEDFNISSSDRKLFLEGLFRRLQDRRDFRMLVTAFAIDHPYFRQWPIKIE